MNVTARSPFRELGNTDRASFKKALGRTIAGPSPMTAEADAIYDALEPHGLTRLAAAMAWIERRNETDPGGLRYYGRNLHNAWAIKRAGSWARYDSYEDAAKDWAERVLGPTYDAATTLAEFINIYAPSFENDTNRYIQMAVDEVNALPRQVVIVEPDEPDPGDGPVDPWRPYPYPEMVNVHVTKAYDGAGFDRVRPRGPRIVGVCNHITDGDPSGDELVWYQKFFSVGGERAGDALTDTVLGRDGRLGLLNDWRDPEWGGRRAGWANGTATGIEGDGIAFYRKYPLINDVLVSIEHVARAGQALTEEQLETSVEMSTAIAQSVRCPWDTYPYHPGLGGVNIEQMHRNFAPKSCPAEPFVSSFYPKKIDAVKSKLRAWQGDNALPKPQPDPPPPVWYTRFGFSLEEIKGFFGRITRYNRDHTQDEFGFDPNGALSLLWLERCDREGKFPEAERIWYADAKFVDGEEMWASWEGGWMAYLPLVDSRATWRWLDEAE